MSTSNDLQIQILQDRQIVFSENFDRTIEIGRQRKDEVAPFAINRQSEPHRLIIASNHELNFSRSYARIEILGDQLQITNTSARSSIEVNAGPLTGGKRILAANETVVVGLPVTLRLGNREIEVQPAESDLVGLAQQTLPPSMAEKSIEQTFTANSLLAMHSPDQMVVPELMTWLRNVLELFQHSPGTTKFFEHSTAAVAHMLNLDSAAILFREDNYWQVRHAYHRNGRIAEQWRPSFTILNAVCRNVRAYRQVPSFNDQQPESLMGVHSLVAAPILSPESQVIGALYGDKRIGQAGSVGEISEVETMFVELLASGVAAGLARLEKERQVLAARVRFEQFFPSGLVDKLEADQDFLKGKNSDVTVMFCDIRKFSQIAERVGPEITVEFISDALQHLSVCVQTHQGVLVDYIGDELIAMWGAPDNQPNHANMAVQAGHAMLNCVPEINDRWKDRIGTDFQIGIGINSGIAQVGNIGSKLRFKYGPLGNPVNIASRVQGVTKQLQIPFLVTAETASRLDQSTPYRRLGQVQLVNVSQPVTICEIPGRVDDSWYELKARFEEGLELFENQYFSQAYTILSEILKKFPHDTPSIKLLSRAEDFLSNRDTNPNTIVWQLNTK